MVCVLVCYVNSCFVLSCFVWCACVWADWSWCSCLWFWFWVTVYYITHIYILYSLSGYIDAIYMCACASYVYTVSITRCKRYMVAVYKVLSRIRDAARVRCPWDSLKNKKHNEGDTGTPKESIIPIRNYHELEDKPQGRRKVEKEERKKRSNNRDLCCHFSLIVLSTWSRYIHIHMQVLV